MCDGKETHVKDDQTAVRLKKSGSATAYKLKEACREEGSDDKINRKRPLEKSACPRSLPALGSLTGTLS
jgi:hypothetical protein